MSHSNIFTHPSILVRGLVKQRKDRVLLAEIPKWRAKRWKTSSVFIQPQMRQNSYVASIKSYLLSNERGFSTTCYSSDFQSGYNVGAHGFQVPCLGFAGLISRIFNPIFMLQIVKIRKPSFYPWQLPYQSKIKEDGPLQTWVLLKQVIGKITRGFKHHPRLGRLCMLVLLTPRSSSR